MDDGTRHQRPLLSSHADITGGLSNVTLLAISAVGFVILVSVLFLVMRKGSNEYDDEDGDKSNNNQRDYVDELQDRDAATLNRAQRRARVKLKRIKNRRLERDAALQHHQHQDQANNDHQDGRALMIAAAVEEDHDDDDNDGRLEQLQAIKSRKERQKEAKAQEREELRTYEKQRRELIQESEELASRARHDKARQEEETRLRLERIRRNKEKRELLERTYMFPSPSPFDENGHYDNNEEEDTTTTTREHGITIRQFVEQVMNQKILHLEKEAETLGVDTRDLVVRVRQLEKEMRLFGMFDEEDRHFVSISPNEMNRIANFVIARGKRVTMTDLASELPNILNL